MIVLNIRKISRKLILIAIISIIIFFSSYIINSEKAVNGTKVISSLNTDGLSNFFKFTLDQTVPGIAQVSNNVEFSPNFFNILEDLLAYELPLFESVTYIEQVAEEKKETLAANDSTLNTDEGVAHAQIGLPTEVLESNVPNSYTDDFEGTQIKNGTNLELTDDIFDTSTLDINKNDVIIFEKEEVPNK